MRQRFREFEGTRACGVRSHAAPSRQRRQRSVRIIRMLTPKRPSSKIIITEGGGNLEHQELALRSRPRDLGGLKCPIERKWCGPASSLRLGYARATLGPCTRALSGRRPGLCTSPPCTTSLLQLLLQHQACHHVGPISCELYRQTAMAHEVGSSTGELVQRGCRVQEARSQVRGPEAFTKAIGNAPHADPRCASSRCVGT